MFRKRYSIQYLINLIFLIMFSAYGLIIIFSHHLSTTRILEDFSERATEGVSKNVEQMFQKRATLAKTVFGELSNSQVMEITTPEEARQWRTTVSILMKLMPGAEQLQLVSDNGRSFALAKADPNCGVEGAFWVGRGIVANQTVEQGFFDQKFKELKREVITSKNVDPRDQPGFKVAKPGKINLTAPYLSPNSSKTYFAFSQRSQLNNTVLIIESQADYLSNTLYNTGFVKGTIVNLIDSKMNLLASNKYKNKIRDSILNEQKTFKVSENKLNGLHKINEKFQNSEVSWQEVSEDTNWMTYLKKIEVSDSMPLWLTVSIPKDVLIADAITIRNRQLVFALILLIISLTFVSFFSYRISAPIKVLTDEVAAVRNFKLSEPVTLDSKVEEVYELAQSVQLLKKTLVNFLDILKELAMAKEFDDVLHTIVDQSTAVGQADGAVMMMVPEGKEDSLEVLFADGAASKLQNKQFDVIGIFRKALKSTTPFSLVYERNHDENCPLNEIQAKYYRFFALKDRFNQPSGLLCLCYESIDNFNDTDRVKFIETFINFATLTMESRHMISQQKALLDSFIKILAIAVDAKSPYTGGHCQRVPEIATMLTKAICDQSEGQYADFKLNDEQWDELRIAAWLHDCGKVTTPEYVMDKATKLETIYDRIHEIRTRFELLKKQSETDFWQALAGGGSELQLNETMVQRQNQLEDDFNFVAECNVGAEFMSDEKIERLEKISKYTWERTLSDRVGISHEEAERKKSQPEQLPVTEKLLDNRNDHLIVWHENNLIPEDNQWGFKLKMPEFQYNRGELYNLCIRKGTLTEEERYKINDHIIQTIIMLTELPFPNYLKNVPEIAGGHHEKMDGTGYPRKLKGDKLSLLARVMVVADIFEALTASDRPYKKAKTLSETIKIMSFMAKDQHIDSELFKLFLSSKVYLTYAEKFLSPEQIDEVDLTQYLSS